MSVHALTTLSANRALPPLATLCVALAVIVLTWEERRATRRALGQMDDHMLRDIGLDVRSALSEARKPFWKA